MICSITVGPDVSFFFGLAGFLFLPESVPEGGSEEGAGEDESPDWAFSTGAVGELLIAAGTGAEVVAARAFEAVAFPFPFLAVIGVAGSSGAPVGGTVSSIGVAVEVLAVSTRGGAGVGMVSEALGAAACVFFGRPTGLFVGRALLTVGGDSGMSTVLSTDGVEGPAFNVGVAGSAERTVDVALSIPEPLARGASSTTLCFDFFFFAPVTEDDLRLDSFGFCFKSNSSFEIRKTFFDEEAVSMTCLSEADSLSAALADGSIEGGVMVTSGIAAGLDAGVDSVD